MYFLNQENIDSFYTDDVPFLCALLFHEIISPASGLISATNLLPELSPDDIAAFINPLKQGGETLRSCLDFLRLGFASIEGARVQEQELLKIAKPYFALKEKITLTWDSLEPIYVEEAGPYMIQLLFWIAKRHCGVKEIMVSKNSKDIHITCDGSFKKETHILYHKLGSYIHTEFLRKKLLVSQHIGDNKTSYILKLCA